MVVYKCLGCQKEVPYEFLTKRVRCPLCGHKIVYKPLMITSTIEAL